MSPNIFFLERTFNRQNLMYTDFSVTNYAEPMRPKELGVDGSEVSSHPVTHGFYPGIIQAARAHQLPLHSRT